jgi:Ca-activated chloride channel family protein
MSFKLPIMIAVAIVVTAALIWGYTWLDRRRRATLAAVGVRNPIPRQVRIRQHIPPSLFLVALALLLVAAARPQATVSVPRAAGTVVLAFDVSNSMTAKDVTPSRLAAAQAAGDGFVKAQPDSVDIGVVAFDEGALTTHAPAKDHDQAIAAIDRLKAAGSTSLGQAILASLGVITGKMVSLPDPNSTAPAPNLGYWGSATIVLLSDGEDTGGPDALAAAALAADAGVHIETVGFGTTGGATITVDGYQVATSLNEDLLTQIAQTTAGSYHRAGDAQALNTIYRSLDLRITSKPEFMELTGAAVGLAIGFLLIGGMLMITWFGRIL